MLTSRRALLLVAFYLLTSAATAHAECAWVLWWNSAGTWVRISVIVITQIARS